MYTGQWIRFGWSCFMDLIYFCLIFFHILCQKKKRRITIFDFHQHLKHLTLTFYFDKNLDWAFFSIAMVFTSLAHKAEQGHRKAPIQCCMACLRRIDFQYMLQQAGWFVSGSMLFNLWSQCQACQITAAEHVNTEAAVMLEVNNVLVFSVKMLSPMSPLSLGILIIWGLFSK